MGSVCVCVSGNEDA